MRITAASQTIALTALALVAALPLATRNAAAEVEYPWCAAYIGPARGVVTCGFVTWEQCMATVHGVGGFCQRNPRLAYAPYTPKRQRRVRQY